MLIRGLTMLTLSVVLLATYTGCSGDEGGGDTSPSPAPTTGTDADGDGYATDTETGGDDCDDSNPDISPGATEVCDGIDNNCDGAIDDGDAAPEALYEDTDGDGYGATESLTSVCGDAAGYADNGGDCDDTDGSVNPEATEVCDGVDNNCDGKVDDGLASPSVWYADEDGDHYGNPEATQYACTIPDGYSADSSDCDDTNADIHPRGDEVCDGLDNDCDESIDEGEAAPATWYADSDQDGYGNALDTVSACAQPDGYVADASDCDDLSANNYPGADEVCDEADNDCDLEIDEGDAGPSTWYQDSDQDGYGDAEVTILSCVQQPSTADNPDDCDDGLSNVYPGADEICDEVDNDCDQQVDEGDASPPTWYQDQDQDQFGADGVTTTACGQPDGYAATGGDCDDQDAAINPSAVEICDTRDNNCNGEIDEGDAEPATWYVDGDSDGYGSGANTLSSCESPAGYVSNQEDCDDSSALVNPEATEICDGIDNNCDSRVDEDEAAPQTWYPDLDLDGYGDAAAATTVCEPPDGYIRQGGDCADDDPAINPEGTEVCDGIDNDCNDSIDDGSGTPTTWYADTDIDGYGDTDSTQAACELPDGYVSEGGDCDDTNPSVNPDADELCDGLDNDCNDLVDDGNGTPGTWYLDNDGDGYGQDDQNQQACDAPAGHAADGGDCNDDDPEISPGATEVCDTIDNNCDGQVDEGEAAPDTWYVDSDGDGYGSGESLEIACGQPDGYVNNVSDCDDQNAEINPEATEVCDELDNDCDGTIDQNAFGAPQWNIDADGDGYGSTTDVIVACGPAPEGYVANGTDCDDTDAAIHPGADEVCDGIDNDCTAVIDDNPVDGEVYYADVDLDGYGNSSSAAPACSEPANSTQQPGDCDDSDATVYPGAEESCDGIDNDCDGTVDEATAAAYVWYVDADTDGFGEQNTNNTLQQCDQPIGYVDNHEDCDDSDSQVYPGGNESPDDGLDANCDGYDNNLTIEDLVAGELVINEIMQNPRTAIDNVGEWFEIYNSLNRYVDLLGMQLYDKDVNDLIIDSSLVVDPEGYVVLANNSDSSTNGGVPVDYEYPGGEFLLSNADDEIFLANSVTIIDKVIYDNGVTFPDPDGASMTLDLSYQNATDNDIGANWCEATTKYNALDYGTPGAANDRCF